MSSGEQGGGEMVMALIMMAVMEAAVGKELLGGLKSFERF